MGDPPRPSLQSVRQSVTPLRKGVPRPQEPEVEGVEVPAEQVSRRRACAPSGHRPGDAVSVSAAQRICRCARCIVSIHAMNKKEHREPEGRGVQARAGRTCACAAPSDHLCPPQAPPGPPTPRRHPSRSPSTQEQRRREGGKATPPGPRAASGNRAGRGTDPAKTQQGRREKEARKI